MDSRRALESDLVLLLCSASFASMLQRKSAVLL